MIKIEPVSETSLIIYLGDQIDLQLTQVIAQLTHYLELHFSEQLVDVTPSYTSILIQYHPLKINFKSIQVSVLAWANKELESKKDRKLNNDDQYTISRGKTITLPVYYDVSVGPDLASLAKEKNLSIEQVITLHQQKTYTVCAIGFAPGFAFLASVDSSIATPRHAEPRLKIPAGSVGIADQQTAVYPDDSPGGWQIIGNCPQQLFSPNTDPISPFEVGDKVTFEAIDRQTFLDLGGVIWPHWK
ncbi:allophanate hydrolase subunit 1 [Photobacterium frigidiphilum]|uniref:Allophanate hydrolase subunit 1 n=1 Tax=Photobacterium frigidiphilum TaxID=264736 RepID=A0A2T3JCI6_9GAMM|nr:5-oxoprolinase subunit PxpB [Photobacterium frigidiphilum]PSU46569.1 allophanate hydrolase subunit 1 [Photobacterium frigidiphilum]